MSDSIIMERVACAAADCLYPELLKTEDFEAFERIVAADMRSVAAMALGKCIERFDAGLRVGVTLLGTMPETTILHNEELIYALNLLDFETLKQLPGIVMVGWKQAKQQ